MSATRDELHQLVESLPEKELDEVLSFVKILLQEPEELTEEEWREVREGKEEIHRGEWMWWQDIKRTDI